MEKKTDLRRLKHSELTVFREQAIKQIQCGVSVGEVCKGMGVSRAAMFRWLAQYRDGGWGALDAGKRGGRRPKLDGEEYHRGQVSTIDKYEGNAKPVIGWA